MLGTASYQLDQDIEAEALWHRHCSIWIMFWWLLPMPQLPISITALWEVLCISILHIFLFSPTWRFLRRILQNASRLRSASLPWSTRVPSSLHRLLKVGLIVILRWLSPLITKSWLSLIIHIWLHVLRLLCHTDVIVLLFYCFNYFEKLWRILWFQDQIEKPFCKFKQ